VRHNLGRFRISVTTAEPPIPVSKRYGPAPAVMHGTVPESVKGGILAITNVGHRLSLDGQIGGKNATFQQVHTQRAPWQAWRVQLGPSTVPRPFELSVATSMPSDRFTDVVAVYFIPK